MEAVKPGEWNPAGFTCRGAGENIPLPNQLQHGTSPPGLSVLVNPRGERAPGTCGGQASRTHSWGSCISNSHFLCHSEQHGKQEELAAWGPSASGDGICPGAQCEVNMREDGEDYSGEGKQAFRIVRAQTFPQRRGKGKREL